MSQAQGLGEKLKALRQSQGLSQRALAQLAGLTHGNLSHIEQGKISPSVLTLEKILTALNIPLASFFAMAEPRAILAAADWASSHEAGVHWSFMEVLATLTPTYLVVHQLQPGAVQCRDFLRHRGLLAGYLVSGRLELSLDDTRYSLSPGDGFSFSHQRSFRLSNHESTAATWLGVSLLPAESQPLAAQ